MKVNDKSFSQTSEAGRLTLNNLLDLNSNIKASDV